jgi:hypothetical protein
LCILNGETEGEVFKGIVNLLKIGDPHFWRCQ